MVINSIIILDFQVFFYKHNNLNTESIDIVFEYLFKNAHVKHYPPSNKIWSSPYWSYHIPAKGHFVEVLKKYIDEGYKIKTGWVGTYIKGYRDNVIFISEPFSNKGYQWDVEYIKIKLDNINNKHF